MTERLKRIYSELNQCHTFADIGCDHGYLTKAMLEGKKCENAIISDVSAKCLKKAEELLGDYIEKGVVKSVVSDGFDKVQGADLALIAGMGGEEISHILKEAKELPINLVLQPMKNVDKVRLCAVSVGYKIIKDFVFFAGGKYYDLIVLQKGEDNLTDEEVEFGRTNLNNPEQAFKDQIAERIAKLNVYLNNSSLSVESSDKIKNTIKKLGKYV